jgi:hypothetical protein
VSNFATINIMRYISLTLFVFVIILGILPFLVGIMFAYYYHKMESTVIDETASIALSSEFKGMEKNSREELKNDFV